jgi:hypothetical protein
MAEPQAPPVERPTDTFEDVKRQRELERVVMDAAQARDLGVEKQAEELAKAVSGAGEADEGDDVSVELDKGTELRVEGGITLVLEKKVKAKVRGAGTPDDAAATLAANPILYSSVRDQLEHEREGDDGRRYRISYGAHGVGSSTPMVNSSGETIAPRVLSGQPEPGDKPIRSAEEQAEAQEQAAREAEKQESGSAKTASKTSSKTAAKKTSSKKR